MFIKNLKSIGLAVLLALPISLPVRSEAALSCADLFLSVEQRQSRSFSFFPKFITERSQRSIVSLAAKDPRLASLRLAEASTVLEGLDNFTSPALIQTSVLHRKAPADFGKYLKSTADASNAISTSISATNPVPEHIKVMFDLFESRYRTAVEILGAAYATKTGAKLDLRSSDYAFRLIERLRNSVIEISNSSKYKNYFSDFDFRSVNWNTVASRIEVGPGWGGKII